MFNVATAYYNGDGIGISDEEALAWFIAAQAFGNKQAEEAVQRSLSDTKPVVQASGIKLASQMLLSGVQIPSRPEAAIVWLQKLSDSGHKIATVMLAQVYLEGKGVLKNIDLAVQYCEGGANAKLPEAMRCLGYLYREGIGKPSDAGESIKWYTKAAKCGDPVSMLALSEMYGAGEGVKVDRAQQYALLQAAAQFLPDARPKAEELKQQLSEKELNAAQKKAIIGSGGCNMDLAIR